jgi:hypothetical protein
MKTRLVFALCLLVAAVAGGCSRNVHITGKVTYANGQPLKGGQIIFTDDYCMGRSDIDPNGEYSIHTLRRNDGMPKGTYKVYITGAFGFTEEAPTGKGLQSYRMDTLSSLIDMQFTNPDASGWEFEVQKNSKIDLVVYPPGEVPEEQRTETAKYMFDPEYRKQVDGAKGPPKPGEASAKPNKKRLVNPNLL